MKRGRDKTLDKVFNPSSVAVIGASEVPGKFAERRTRTLVGGDYHGNIYLVNPQRAQLFSRKAYPSILDIGNPVDLVVVIVPARFITSVVADSIKMGAKGIIIMTAGLGESQVALETTNPSSPGVIRPVGVDNYIHVVMPMFVQW